MKKIIGLSLLLFSVLLSYGQIPNRATVSNAQTRYEIPNMFAMLSAKLPVIDTTNNKATPYTGALTILPSDTLDKSVIPPIYISNGRFWGKLVGGGGGVGVDSVTFPETPNRQICIWSGGFSQCYAIGGYYDSTGYNNDSTYYYHYSNGAFVDSVWIPHTHVYAGQAVGFRDTTWRGFPAQIFNAETHYVTDDSLYYVTLNPDGSIRDSTEWLGLGSDASNGITLIAANTTVLSNMIRNGRVNAIVTDTFTGGSFNYSADALTDDYGITFPASGGGHWVRDISQANGINICWFNVIPTNTAAQNTTNFAAMQAAIPPYSTLWVPNGVYLHNGIVISKGLNIRGESQRYAILKNVLTGGDAITINTGIERCFIEDVGIFGDGTLAFGTDATTGHGIVLNESANMWNFNRIWMRGHGDDFIYCDSLGNVNNINITNCVLDFGKKSAIHLYQRSYTHQINAIFISGNNITFFGQSNIEVWGSNISIENNAIQASKGRGITADGADGWASSTLRGLNINDNYFELCDSGFIYLSAKINFTTGNNRYIFGANIEGNFGIYSQNSGSGDQSGNALFEVVCPSWFSYDNLQVSGVHYGVNSFDINTDTIAHPFYIRKIFNGNNVLSYNSTVERAVGNASGYRIFYNTGRATVLGQYMIRGTGAPEGNVTGETGTLFLRTDGGAGTILYIKESSPTTTTGWVAYRTYTASGRITLSSGVIGFDSINLAKTNATNTFVPNQNFTGFIYSNSGILASSLNAVNIYHNPDIDNGVSVAANGTTTITSGNRNTIQVADIFTTPSGTATYSMLKLLPIVNQSAGGTGITSGLWIAPTLTSTSDWRSVYLTGNAGHSIYQSGAASKNYLAGLSGFGTAATTTSYASFGASTTAISSLNIGQGVAPTSPNHGDIWTTSSHLYGRLNGVTYQLDQQFDSSISGIHSQPYNDLRYLLNQTSQQPSSNFNISGSGVVGTNLVIGTTSTTYPLRVYSTASGYTTLASIEGTMTGAGATRLQITNPASTFMLSAYGSGASGSLASAAAVYASVGSKLFLGSGSGMDIQFGANDSYAGTPQVTIKSAGNVLIGTTTDDGTNKFQVTGTVKATQFRLSALNTAPSSASDTGTTGEIRIVNGFIYICVATNTWQRAVIATF